MSTISKLDPTIRGSRYERRAYVRALQRIRLSLTGKPRIACELTYQALDAVRRDPTRTGVEKQRVFNLITQRLKETAT